MNQWKCAHVLIVSVIMLLVAYNMLSKLTCAHLSLTEALKPIRWAAPWCIIIHKGYLIYLSRTSAFNQRWIALLFVFISPKVILYVGSKNVSICSLHLLIGKSVPAVLTKEIQNRDLRRIIFSEEGGTMEVRPIMKQIWMCMDAHMHKQNARRQTKKICRKVS